MTPGGREGEGAAGKCDFVTIDSMCVAAEEICLFVVVLCPELNLTLLTMLCVCVCLFCIHREFARWKVRNTAIERRDLIRNPVPLMPEFQRSVRLLGRRPTTQQFIETIIKKYGTHLLISATLGGETGSLSLFCKKQ